MAACRDADEGFTACSQCVWSCHWPHILSCGHVICKACLSRFQAVGSVCRCCDQPVSADSPSAEPILYDLVYQHLSRHRNLTCGRCGGSERVQTSCDPCQMTLCDRCSGSHPQGHRRHRLKLHVLSEDSPPTLTLKSRTESWLEKNLVQMVSQRDPGLGSPPTFHTASTSQAAAWKRAQVRLLEDRLRELENLTQAAEKTLQTVKSLTAKAETSTRVLQAYAIRLSMARVTGETIVGLNAQDASRPVQLPPFRSRLKDVVQSCVRALRAEELRDKVTRFSTSVSQQLGTQYSAPPTAIPHTVLLLHPADGQVQPEPDFSDMLVTPTRRLVLTDPARNRVHLMPLSDPSQPATVDLPRPRCLALLADQRLAVTADHSLCLLTLGGDRLAVKSRRHTLKDYVGVVMAVDGSLIVNCERSSQGPASVDVLDDEGNAARRLADSRRLPGLQRPGRMAVVGDSVLVPDRSSHMVFVLHVPSGDLLQTLAHEHLLAPSQVLSDTEGQLYFVSEESQGVLVRPLMGKSRWLTRGLQHGARDYNCPVGLSLTESGFVVLWKHEQDGHRQFLACQYYLL